MSNAGARVKDWFDEMNFNFNAHVYPSSFAQERREKADAKKLRVDGDNSMSQPQGLLQEWTSSLAALLPLLSHSWSHDDRQQRAEMVTASEKCLQEICMSLPKQFMIDVAHIAPGLSILCTEGTLVGTEVYEFLLIVCRSRTIAKDTQIVGPLAPETRVQLAAFVRRLCSLCLSLLLSLLRRSRLL